MLTYPVKWSDNPEHPELRRVFAWQTRVGLAPRFGSVSIQEYQLRQVAVLDAIEAAIRRSNVENGAEAGVARDVRAVGVDRTGLHGPYMQGCFISGTGRRQWRVIAYFSDIASDSQKVARLHSMPCDDCGGCGDCGAKCACADAPPHCTATTPGDAWAEIDRGRKEK